MQSSGLYIIMCSSSTVNELGDTSVFYRLGYFELRDVTLTQQALLDRITKHYIQQVHMYVHTYVYTFRSCLPAVPIYSAIQPSICDAIVHTGPLLLYSVCIVL